MSDHDHEGSFGEGEAEDHHAEEYKGSFAEGQEEEQHAHKGDFASGQEAEERNDEDRTHGSFARGKTFINQPEDEVVEEVVIVEDEIELREET